jgi:transglutaminase-like putative cysteine protease
MTSSTFSSFDAPPAVAVDAQPRLPWSLTGAVLAAMGAALATGEHYVLMSAFMTLVLAGRFVPWRLPDRLIVRGGCYFTLALLLLSAVGLPREEIPMWYIKPDYMNRLALLLAGDLVIRAFLDRGGRRAPNAWGGTLMVSAVLMVCATTTYESRDIRIFAPVYMVLAVFSARAIVRAGNFRPLRSSSGVAWRVGAVLLATGIGGVGVLAIDRYERRLGAWAVELLRSSDRSRNTEIGLAGEARLRESFNPTQSMERVLSLEGVQSERHLRVFAFERYANGRWYPNLDERRYDAVEQRDLAPATRQLRPQRVRIVPHSESAREFLSVPFDAIRLDSSAALARDTLGVLRPLVGERLDEYHVTLSDSGNLHVALPPAPTPEQRQTLLTLHNELDPRVSALARELAGDGNPAQRLTRIVSALRTRNEYSLTFKPSGEPLNDFILNRRPGHCQYFGSATVILARAAGIPARFVVGFYAHERESGNTVVRERDAHAWAECWIDGVGWVLADATPASGTPAALAGNVTAFQTFTGALAELPLRLRDYLLGEGRFVAMGLLVAVVGAVLLVRAHRARVRRGSRALAYSSNPDLLRLARRFDAYLSRHATGQRPGLTWREALLAADLPPAVAGPCGDFLDEYDRARFDPTGAPDLTRLRILIVKVESIETTTGVRPRNP